MQLEIDEELVGRLLASQFSRFAGLPIRRVATGTVNAVFRAGDDLAVRLPLSPAIQDWDVDCALGALAGRLPLDVPAVLGTGEPDYGYPLKWSLHTWIDGEQWRFDRVEDPVGAAVTLAEFLTALQAIDPTTLPCPPLLAGHVNPLRTADVDTRAPAALSTNFDSDVARRLWDEAAHAPGWDAPPRLIHWDLLRGNVLIRRGRLAGVIDWGALTAADPARDLIAAWTLFRGESRAAFRATAPGDDAAWARARGWAMTLGARTISKVLADPL